MTLDRGPTFQLGTEIDAIGKFEAWAGKREDAPTAIGMLDGFSRYHLRIRLDLPTND